MLGLSPGSRAMGPTSEAAAAVLAAAVAQLRQSAGVYDYLAKQVLPALFLTIKGDRWDSSRIDRGSVRGTLSVLAPARGRVVRQVNQR
jgi:hypothetical protein